MQATSAIQSERGERKGRANGAAAPRAIDRGEWRGLVDWLDDALRSGERGRLEAEFPLSLDASDPSRHRAVFDGDAPVAHAMLHVAHARAGDRVLPLGLIGLVYTAPSRRGEGLAHACVEACLAELRRREVPVAALWTDRHALYAGLGFKPAGSEDHYALDAPLCRAAWRSAGGDAARPLRLDVPRARDWPALEALYARKPSAAVRARGQLKRLAAAPETRVIVARRGGRAIAYAAVGRGLDFPGVVHEWAGSELGVLACLEALAEEIGPLGWRCGPVDEPPAPRLREAGASGAPGCFALAKVLDPVGVWRRLVGPRLDGTRLALEGCPMRPRLRATAGTIDLSPEEVSALFLGPRRPGRVLSFLSQAEHDALAPLLPAPIYVWGFDSI